jgi:NAD-dependent deacetylase
MPEATLHEVAVAVVDRLGPEAIIVASTGAGISKASGISTFRGSEGLWNTHRSEDVCTHDVLMHDPATFWRFHDHLRAMIVNAVPNPAHMVLAEMEEILGESTEFAVITQNIDRLHQRAGSQHVIELHGDALEYECMRCGYAPEDIPVPTPEYPPRCEKCGAVVRPKVVLFGESLPSEALDEARDLCSEADVMFVIGTSVVVEPAASLPFLALAAGALVVEINTASTPLTGAAQYSVQSSSSSALPALWEQMQEALRQS